MSGPFTGYWENAVHNQRVIIPVNIKRKFSDDAHKTVVITVGPMNSIALYPLDSWYDTLAKLEVGDEEQRRFRTRLIDCAVTEAELEGPGRIRVPERLLAKARITDSVIVKGENHYITLWNPEAYYAKNDKDWDDTGNRMDTHTYQEITK